jgi:hypothetical protein
MHPTGTGDTLDILLYGDLVSIAAPAVKWAREVAHANQIPILVRRALHDSQTAPTGAVFLSFPMDVMEEVTTTGIGEVSTIDRSAIAGSLDRLAEYSSESNLTFESEKGFPADSSRASLSRRDRSITVLFADWRAVLTRYQHGRH